VIPEGADRVLFSLAPGIAVASALSAIAVIPFGQVVSVFGHPIELYIADVDIGILYILAVGSLGVYGLILGGWASNNKFSLLGGLRSSAQMVSYELSLGLALVGPLMLAGTLRMQGIVEAQRHLWFICLQPLGFLIYVISALAETNRIPFDLPEAESELVAGYHVEYSGFKFAFFFLAEYVAMITVACVATTLFLGGYHGIGLTSAWLGPVWFMGKVALLLFSSSGSAAPAPRFRYDQLMQLGLEGAVAARLRQRGGHRVLALWLGRSSPMELFLFAVLGLTAIGSSLAMIGHGIRSTLRSSPWWSPSGTTAGHVSSC
jgi:NADH-quinone oxidoreductase subunit H